MYRVGFGDCFLVSVSRGESQAHILIDCGVHSQGDIGTMEAIVNDVAAECGKHLSLIIATHAHQDHISGFAKYDDVFKGFTVDEVWLPWTEDPNDADARKVKQKHVALTEMLRAHMNANKFKLDETTAGRAFYAVLNAAGNADALKLLKVGVRGGTVRYLEAGNVQKDAAGISGLTVKVLGPPRDKKFLARMDPPQGDRFMRLNASGKPVPANAVQPFEHSWKVRAQTYPEVARLNENDQKALKDLVDNATALAFSLDQAINNTSLVTLLSYQGKNLLFPGDAQYGNWQYWMNTPEGESILQQVDFFKVAHHGSHNATPKSALEKMRDGFAAMISTQGKPWPSIPFEKLLKRLDGKARGVVRSDSITIATAKKTAPKGPQLKLTQGFKVGPFWCDYTISP